MSITESQSQKKYLAALKLLIDIGGSINATSAVRDAAKQGIVALSTDFINIRLNRIDLRYDQVEAFILEMNAVIEAANDITPFKALEKLQTLMDTTKAELDDAVVELEEELAGEEDEEDG